MRKKAPSKIFWMALFDNGVNFGKEPYSYFVWFKQ